MIDLNLESDFLLCCLTTFLSFSHFEQNLAFRMMVLDEFTLLYMNEHIFTFGIAPSQMTCRVVFNFYKGYNLSENYKPQVLVWGHDIVHFVYIIY